MTPLEYPGGPEGTIWPLVETNIDQEFFVDHAIVKQKYEIIIYELNFSSYIYIMT